jgi:hypothetical protein
MNAKKPSHELIISGKSQAIGPDAQITDEIVQKRIFHFEYLASHVLFFAVNVLHMLLASLSTSDSVTPSPFSTPKGHMPSLSQTTTLLASILLSLLRIGL